MTPNDRTEVREMLLDILSGPLEKIDGQYRLMTNQLSNIEVQTLKTNGRVSTLETELRQVENEVHTQLPHTIDGCPQKGVIQEIRDSMITDKGIKKTIFLSITAASALITIIFMAIKLFSGKL